MNDQVIKGKWTEAKGTLQNAWGKISADEFEETKGNLKSIAGLIQQKYGHAKEEVTAKLHDLMAKFMDATETSKEDAGSTIAKKSEDLKNDVKQSRPYPNP